MFNYPSNIQAIANLQDGSYLVYYKDEQPALEGLFSSSHIIAHHFWNPVGRIDGHILTESKRGNNMYLIGDYNIVGLEEAFITGLFAANQIIHS